MEQSVFDGTNKPSHDIASGVHVGKDNLDDGMFGHTEASKRQRHSSQHQSAKQQPAEQAAQERRERGERKERKKERKEGRKSEEKVVRQREKKETGEDTRM